MLEAFMMTAFFPIFMFICVLAISLVVLKYLSLYVIILVVGIYKATIFIFNKIYKLLIVIYKAMVFILKRTYENLKPILPTLVYKPMVFILKKTYENLQGILATLVIVFMALAVFLDWV